MPSFPADRTSAPRAHRRRGITLIEVTISILILTVAAYMLSSTISASLTHNVAKREQAIAVEATMNAMETLRATPFIDVFRSFNEDPDDDPLGSDTAPGPNFDVDGLDPIVEPGGQRRPIGTVILPELAGLLREDLNMPELGLPRDLNGDIMVDAFDHSGDFLVLPVVVRLEWQGRLGERHFEMSTMLVDLQRESDQE